MGLLTDIRVTAVRALAEGALRPIGTQSLLLDQDGIIFHVRLLSGLAQKVAADHAQRQRQAQGEVVNPFLPYEQALYVRHVGDSHVCLLNKYNVVDDHILLITERFQPQAEGISRDDFNAMAICGEEITGLWFFNSEPAAGASQAHKHLQFIPCLANASNLLPVSPWIDPYVRPGVFQVAAYPCRNGLVGLSGGQLNGREMFDAYQLAMEQLQLWRNDGTGLSWPHNVLITEQWLMVVPRTRSMWEGFGINALGYAGTLFIRCESQLEKLREIGVTRLMAEVGCQKAPDTTIECC